MRTGNPAKAKSVEVTEKVIFSDATEQTTKGHPMRWTLNKLLLGAGAGADPTEIDVSAGAIFTELAGGENIWKRPTTATQAV